MKTRQLVVLAVLAVVSVVATAIVKRGGPTVVTTDRHGERVFQTVMDKANDITGMTIRQGPGNDTIVIERGKTGFVEATSGFPVKTDAVRDLVASTIELTYDEARTSDPARYYELGLTEPGEPYANQEITLRTAGGEIADFFVGHRETAVGGAVGGVFMRVKGQPQAWLVRGILRTPTIRAEWFDAFKFDVKREQIKKIELIGGGREGVTVTTSADKPGELTLENVPENRTADSAKLTKLAAPIEALAFRDVRKKTQAPDDPRRMVVDVDDGLKITITSVGDQLLDAWVQIAVEATSDAEREKASALTAKTEGYDFRLNYSQGEVVGWTSKELTSEPKS